MLLSNVQRLLELPRPHGGGADVAGLAGPHHVMQRFHRLLDGCLVVPAMDLVEVYVLRPEPLQALVDLAQDRFARQPGAIRSRSHAAVYLGSDDDLVPIREVLQGTSEDFLTRPERIDVGGIEEVDPQFQGVLDDRPAVFLMQHPLVNPPFRIPEPHAPKADARHIHPGVPELGVFHVTFLSSYHRCGSIGPVTSTGRSSTGLRFTTDTATMCKGGSGSLLAGQSKLSRADHAR